MTDTEVLLCLQGRQRQVVNRERGSVGDEELAFSNRRGIAVGIVSRCWPAFLARG